MKKIILLTFLYLTPAIAIESDTFSGWMTQDSLDNYFQVLNNGDTDSTLFDNGYRINAVEGRLKKNTVEYRVKIGKSPADNNLWFWWINQSNEDFIKKLKHYDEDKFRLVFAQSFLMHDGSSRYQGVWHKLVDAESQNKYFKAK